MVEFVETSVAALLVVGCGSGAVSVVFRLFVVRVGAGAEVGRSCVAALLLVGCGSGAVAAVLGRVKGECGSGVVSAAIELAGPGSGGLCH